jgi:hypothetical protein
MLKEWCEIPGAHSLGRIIKGKPILNSSVDRILTASNQEHQLITSKNLFLEPLGEFSPFVLLLRCTDTKYQSNAFAVII